MTARSPSGRRRKLATLVATLGLLAPACGPEPAEPEADGPRAGGPAPALSPDEIPVWSPDPNPDRAPGVRGRFRRAPAAAGPAPPDPADLDLAARLEAIGYAAGSRDAPDRRGITVHDPARAQPGLNFYTSGHAPEALLMDMDGRVLHRWAYDFADAFPRRKRERRNGNARFWRRAVVLPDGDLIALYTGLGIIKLDRDSQLLWARPHPVHHDLAVSATGEILVLTRKAHVVPRVSPEVPIVEDFLAVLGPGGGLRREISLLEAFERAAPEYSWVEASRRFWERERERRRASGRQGALFDVFHTNSVQILGEGVDARSPAFRAGDVLISACHLDTIAVVDLEAGRVTWSLAERFQLQHDPRALPDGSVMVFDNHWMPEGSRVAILDPTSGDLVWEYVGSPDRPFYSRTCGTSRLLANGNVLITESDGGRAFEVTREKEIVWEFYNPHRAGERDEYIATLFELVRLPADFGAGWLSPAPARAAP